MSLIHSVYDDDSDQNENIQTTTSSPSSSSSHQRNDSSSKLHSVLKTSTNLVLPPPSIPVEPAPDVPVLPRILKYAPEDITSLPTSKVNLTGRSEPIAMNASDFQTQLRLFHRAQVHPSLPTFTELSSLGVPYMDPFHPNNQPTRTLSSFTVNTNPSRKRKAKGDVSIVEGPNAYQGPWAEFEEDDETHDLTTLSTDVHPVSKQARTEESLSDVSHAPDTELDLNSNDTELAPSSSSSSSFDAKHRLITPGSEKSIFHGTSLYDHVGRSYLSVPVVDHLSFRSEPGSQECFLPKKCLHTYKGHTQGVNAIRLFPHSGHLILSASMDTKVKLWDVHTHRQVVRTFLGHNKAVRDICFNNLGTQFLTASYDRYLKLWDTETGQCKQAFTTGKIPFCVKFHPDADKQHIFLTGQQDKKIYQFDSRSGEIIQEYNQHLGAVNTITFVDQNRRFITTSDDKTLRAWEYDIPVVIKYVAEPHMHSMPSIALSPNKKWLACQSLDNQILLYGATDKFKLNRKKSYHGHIVAGYACQVNFSADGRYVMSGDSTGHMYYWDFKTCRLMKKHKAHDNVIMGCEWHPHETSKVVTCSWDGTIKLWD